MSQESSVKLLANVTNSPVVQMAGRSYPGVVIQGDSLRNLCAIIEKLCESLETTGPESAYDHAEWAREILVGYLLVYQDVLKENGIPLPYTSEVQPIPEIDDDDN